MSFESFSGLFCLIFIIECSSLLFDDDPSKQCVLRRIECNPRLQRPCCDSKDYCKQAEFGKSFRCTEKILTPGLGKFCELDEDCDEIWHSMCSNNECVCRANNVQYNETICAPLLGAYCWRKELCATENSVCIEQECRCRRNHSKIANKCILNVLGAHCDNDEVCQQVKFAKCSKENICTCSMNTLAVTLAVNLAVTRCVSLVGGFCRSMDDCLTRDSICVDNKCQCERGMVFKSNKCVNAYIGMSCWKDSDCSASIPNSKCSSSFSCTCELFYTESGRKCLPEHHVRCFHDASCTINNTRCIDGLCQCEFGFVYRYSACIPITLGETCKNDYECHAVRHAVCSAEKKCVCKNNYNRIEENACMPMLGEACDAHAECTVPYSQCIGLKCQCKYNYSKYSDNECSHRALGMKCIDDDDCRTIKNSKCSDNERCLCRDNYFVVDDIECVPILYSYCNNDEKCAAVNATCKENYCQCSDDFLAHYDQCVLHFIGMYCQEDDHCKKISNAKCIDYICICKEGYAKLNDTTCAPSLGQYCQPNERCVTLNAVCIDNKCRCDVDYVNHFDTTCVSKLGHFGISCQDHSYCSDIKYAVCSHEKKCACGSNYVALGETQCIALIDEYCDADNECISYNTICIDHKCRCPKKYIMRSKYRCDRISLGRTCKEDDDCKNAIKNSVCSEDKVCVCQIKHYALGNYECVPFLNEYCSNNLDCRYNSSSCIDNECQCNNLYRAASETQCVEYGSLYTCSKNLDCGDPWHNICSTDKKCICNKNNSFINKSTCSPILGGYCWTDHQCVVKYSKCDDFVCKCRNEFNAVAVNKCMPARQ